MLNRFSRVRLFVTPWTAAHQAPPSMGFFWQEYWSGLPCPPPRDLPDPGIKPTSPEAPALQVKFLPVSHWEAPICSNSTLMNHSIPFILSYLLSPFHYFLWYHLNEFSSKQVLLLETILLTYLFHEYLLSTYVSCMILRTGDEVVNNTKLDPALMQHRV